MATSTITKTALISGGILVGAMLLSQSMQAANFKDDLFVKPGLPRIVKADASRITLAIPATIFNYTNYSIKVDSFSLRLYLYSEGQWVNIGISPSVKKDMHLLSNNSTIEEILLDIDTSAIFSVGLTTPLMVQSVFYILGFPVVINAKPATIKDFLPLDAISKITGFIFKGLGCPCTENVGSINGSLFFPSIGNLNYLV